MAYASFYDLIPLCISLEALVVSTEHEVYQPMHSYKWYGHPLDGLNRNIDKARSLFGSSYRYAKGSAKKIREEFGPCEAHQELYRIADGLAELQRKSFYSIFARIYRSGHYYHEYTMRIECAEDTRRGTDLPIEVETEVLEYMRDLARWLYKQLEESYEWIMSDEQVDESIRCNEYEFACDGSRWRTNRRYCAGVSYSRSFGQDREIGGNAFERIEKCDGH